MLDSKPTFIQKIETYILERSQQPYFVILNSKVYKGNEELFVRVLRGRGYIHGSRQEHVLKEYPNIHIDFTNTIAEKDIVFLAPKSVILSQFD